MSTIEVDLSAARWFSSLRRATVVVLALVVGLTFINVEAAVSAATAALLIGLLDKGRSPRSTWHTMALGTGLMCLVMLIASVLSAYTLAMLLLMALLAFASGVSSGVDPRAPQIFVFGAILAATAVVSPIQASAGLESAALIACAGGLQTLLALLAAPIVGDLPERQTIAAALIEVAKHVEQVGSSAPDLRAGARRASAAMASAEDYVSRSDLAADHRRRYSLLLADADTLRIEARAFSARQSLGLRIPDDDVTLSIFAGAGSTVALAAAAIERPTDTKLTDIDAAVLSVQAIAARSRDSEHSVTRTANAVVDALEEIPDHVRAIARAPIARREHRDNPRPFTERLAASLSWGSRPLKFGARMAAAAIVGEVLGLALHLTHSSWVAVSAMMLLRPDIGPAAPRILIRAVGVTIGVAAVVVLAAIIGTSLFWQVTAVGILVWAMYAVVSVNQGTQVILMTAAIILILSTSGLNPTELAFARWIDVMLGCILGVIFAVAVPLWNRESLRNDAAKYADAVADWLDTLIHLPSAAAERVPAQLLAVRTAGKRARDARQNAMATLNSSLLEPTDREAPAGAIGVVLTWIRRCSDTGVAAETLIRHGSPIDRQAVAFGEAATRDLHGIAATLRQGDVRVDLVDQASLPDDLPRAARVTEVLSRSARTANAALRAAQRIGDR